MSRPSRRIRALLLDKDGTILDYRRTWVPINRDVALFAAGGDEALARQLLRAAGHDPDTDDVAAGTPFAAGGIDDIAACLAGALGSRPPPANFASEIDRIFREGGERHSVMIDGTREAIIELKQRGFIVGLATNDSIGGLEASLSRHDVLHLFDYAVGCDSGHGAKPAPGMALAFAEAVGIAPSEMAVVGDSTHDLEMAVTAGAGLAIAVLSGTGRQSDLAAHADIVLDSLCDVPRLAHFS